MEESSYNQVNRVMIHYLEKGVNCFSPISHYHGLTTLGLPVDWQYWQRLCTQWLNLCNKLIIVIPEEGAEKIRNSKGVNAEIVLAQKIGLPVEYIS
ncbi:MAG: DUF1937 family protein, partial [Nitrososphaeraceae archaeon]|nr:DUF1937 family protein [Nitrososphaeraceae archaeon]